MKIGTMKPADDMGGFLKDSKEILLDYLETRIEIARLKGIKAFSKSAGFLIWVMVFLLMFGLVAAFASILFALWMSKLTGSLIWGFGITTLILVLKLVLLTVFRHQLFVNPIIRIMIRRINSVTISNTPSANEENF